MINAQPFDGDFWDGDLVDDSLEFERISHEACGITPEGKATLKQIIDEIQAEQYAKATIIGKHAERNPKLIITD